MDFAIFGWITSFLICLLGIVLYRFATYNLNYWEKRNVPHLKPLPLIGNLWDTFTLKKSIGQQLEVLYKKFDEPYFGILAFTKPILVLKDPELIKHVLVKDFQYFSDRSIAANEKADSIIANFMFFVKNPRWREVRIKVTSVYTSGKLKSMFSSIKNCANDLVDYINKYSINNKSDDAKEIAAKYTTDVIASTAFGLEANCFKYENPPFRILGRQMFDYSFMNAFRVICYFFSWFLVDALKLKFFKPEVNKFIRTALWKSIKDRETTGIKRNDLVDSIINLKNSVKNESQFEMDRWVAVAGEFFLAGFETTSTTIAFTLYELALNADIQNNLRDEIRATIKNVEDINFDNVSHIKYLNNVISETLRIHPPVVLLERSCVSDYQISNSDLIIEKHTPIYISITGLHNDAKYFPKPETFDPERFDEENILARTPFTYLPFGDGPRSCIGNRFALIVVKLALIHILNNFEVIKSDDTPVPVVYDPKGFTARAVGGLPMKFRKID